MRSSVPPAHPSRQSSTTLVHCLYSEHKYSVGVVCMKEDESLRVERETVTAYRSTRKRQADAKRHVERDEPSRSEGLNCNERLGSRNRTRTQRGNATQRNADGTRLRHGPRDGARATARRARPRPDCRAARSALRTGARATRQPSRPPRCGPRGRASGPDSGPSLLRPS